MGEVETMMMSSGNCNDCLMPRITGWWVVSNTYRGSFRLRNKNIDCKTKIAKLELRKRRTKHEIMLAHKPVESGYSDMLEVKLDIELMAQ